MGIEKLWPISPLHHSKTKSMFVKSHNKARCKCGFFFNEKKNVFVPRWVSTKRVRKHAALFLTEGQCCSFPLFCLSFHVPVPAAVILTEETDGFHRFSGKPAHSGNNESPHSCHFTFDLRYAPRTSRAWNREDSLSTAIQKEKHCTRIIRRKNQDDNEEKSGEV